MRDYAGCAARGLTKAETARELGVSRSAVSAAAHRLGLDFTPSPLARPSNAARNGRYPRTAEHRAAISRGLRVAWALADLAGKRRLSRVLSVGEHRDYLALKAAGFRRGDALRAIGREDLL